MVSEKTTKKGTIYLCEICGFGYADVDTAERCEQYCSSHNKSSPMLTGRAIYKPKVPTHGIAV
jgi:hypothetical protein